jgi:hypothetical protein
LTNYDTEEITKSLKPLEWSIWDGNKYRFAHPTEAHEAMVMTYDDGSFLITISKRGCIDADALAKVSTMQEAIDFVREWQISHFCSYFQINN